MGLRLALPLVHSLFVTPESIGTHVVEDGGVGTNGAVFKDPTAKDYARQAFSDGENLGKTTVCADKPFVCTHNCTGYKSASAEIMKTCDGWTVEHCENTKDPAAKEACCVCGGGKEVPVPKKILKDEQAQLKTIIDAQKKPTATPTSAPSKAAVKFQEGQSMTVLGARHKVMKFPLLVVILVSVKPDATACIRMLCLWYLLQ